MNIKDRCIGLVKSQNLSEENYHDELKLSVFFFKSENNMIDRVRAKQ